MVNIGARYRAKVQGSGYIRCKVNKGLRCKVRGAGYRAKVQGSGPGLELFRTGFDEVAQHGRNSLAFGINMVKGIVTDITDVR